jgi:hypothetical protein
MSFPAANTVYVWRSNDTDYGFGVLDYVDSDSIFLDRFSSVSESIGDVDVAINKAKAEHPGLAIEVISNAGVLAVVDQYVAEIRNAVVENDESMNTFKLAI